MCDTKVLLACALIALSGCVLFSQTRPRIICEQTRVGRFVRHEGNTGVSDLLRVMGVTQSTSGRGIPRLLEAEKIPNDWPQLVIDVGAYDGSDVTIPALVRGFKVLTYEPVQSKADAIDIGISLANVSVTCDHDITRFRQLRAGEAWFCAGVAASNVTGTGIMYLSDGYGDSLASGAAKNHQSIKHTQPIDLQRIDSIVDEDVLLLKVDAQGHEIEVLKGAIGVFQYHRVYFVQLEFYPKGLIASGHRPVELLTFMESLHYTCYNVANSIPISIRRTTTDFAAKHPPSNNWWGKFTDILCVHNSVA